MLFPNLKKALYQTNNPVSNFNTNLFFKLFYRSFYLSPSDAKQLYIKVDKSGQGSQIANLSNYHTPDKIEKTLKVLGIEAKHIRFRGWNGYDLDIDTANIKKINDIVNATEECLPNNNSGKP